MTRTKGKHFQEEELQEIGEYVKSHLHEWLLERDIETRETLIRLETELQGQRELLKQNMTLMEKRFESVEQRLIGIEKSLRTFIYSSFSFTAVAAGVIIAVLRKKMKNPQHSCGKTVFTVYF
jgi:hypothetical protein